MWLKRFTYYLTQHKWSTLLFIFGLAFIPLLGIIAILLAALITLLKGSIEGALATLAATLPYFFITLFYIHGTSIIPIQIWASLGVAVISNVITWGFAVMLYRGSNWSTILQIAALLGVFIISLIHLAYPNIADWWGIQLQNYYTQAKVLGEVVKNATPKISEMQLESINATKKFATGIMTAAILGNALLQLVVARWWQANIFAPGLLRKELHHIRLSQLAGILFVACVLFSYFGNRVIFDIMPVVYLLFFSAGLSVIHYFFAFVKSQTAWFWLLILYTTLIFSIPTSIVVVALVAFIDIWWDIRKYFRA